MATDKVLINRSTMTNIANAIRTKKDSHDLYHPSEMPRAISSIVGGGVGEVETLTIVNKQSFENIQLPTDGTYKTYLLDVAITPSNAPKLTRVILSNPDVAAVVDNGDGTHSLRVRNAGKTTVTVTDYSGTVSDSFEINIVANLEDLWFPYATVDVDEGTSRQLGLIFKPHYASDKRIDWNSNHDNIIVNQDGLVTATGTGHATITATSPVLTKTVSVAVDAGPRNENDPDWAAIQAAVRSGNNPYGIGSELTMPWFDKSNNNKEYALTWIVAHYGLVELKDGTQREGMFLMAKNALPWSMNFENEKRIEVDQSELTAQEGVYYYGLSGSTYTALNLVPGDVIAHELYDHIYKTGANFTKSASGISQSGLNWWAGSSMRQFLNSESDQAGFGFEPHHISDYNGSDNTSKRGFLSGVSSSFLSVLTPIKTQTMRNTTCWNGEIDTTYDKVFLPSAVQLGFTDTATADIEGEPWQYFTEMTSAEKTAALKVIPLGATSASYWWLRSAYRSYANSERYIYSSGSLSSGNAYNIYRIVPACVIC